MAPPPIEKYNAIIIEPSVDARMRLKSATSSVHQFKTVNPLTSFVEAIRKIESTTDTFDLFFISYQFEQEEQKQFIKKVKEIPQTQDCACILMAKPEAQGPATTALSMLIGADGVLFEPYSVDQLIEITRIASRIKNEKAESREKGAIAIIIQELIGQIDRISYGMSLNLDMAPSMKKLKDSGATLRSFTPSMLAAYFSLVVPAFEEAKLPIVDSTAKRYTGASSRVKSRQDKKIVDKLQAEGGAPSAPQPPTPEK